MKHKPLPAKRSIDMSKVNWLLSLDKSIESTIVLTNIKEQNNGLEALGDVIAEGNSETPGKVDESEEGTPPTNEESPDSTDDSSEGDGEDTGDGTTDDSNVADGETEGDPNEEDSLDDNDQADSEGDTGDTSDPRNESLDPNLSLNRRIQISDKLLQLFKEIKDTIDKIANGPSFENKPVKLNSLEKLAENVLNINDSINKEPKHEALLLRYAVCVRTFKRIVEK